MIRTALDNALKERHSRKLSGLPSVACWSEAMASLSIVS
jgi:hypothetical protein